MLKVLGRLGFRPVILTVGVTLLIPSAPDLAMAGQEPGGSLEESIELFRTLKCQLCHAVPAAGIEAKAKSDKVKGSDLGTADSEHTAEEMRAYLLQEVEIDGRRHKKEFTGTEEELAAIVRWLIDLSRQARETADAAPADAPADARR